MASVWISFLASLTYGIPSVFLYILTIFVIIKHRKTFSSSFFILYIFDGIMNLFTYFIGFFTRRLTSITCKDCLLAPFYLNIGNYISIKFVFAMGYHMAYVQYALTTLISFNRLSVLLNYNLLEPIWKSCTWIFVLIIYFVPFFSTHVVFDYEAKVVYLEQLKYYSFSSGKLAYPEILAVLIPFTVIAIFLSVAANIISICIVRNLGTQIRNKAENNFLVIMSITCAVQLIGTAITVALNIFELSPLLMFLIIALPYVSDGLSLVQPWLLICFSNTVRQQVKSTFGVRPKTTGPSSQLFVMRSITS